LFVTEASTDDQPDRGLLVVGERRQSLLKAGTAHEAHLGRTAIRGIGPAVDAFVRTVPEILSGSAVSNLPVVRLPDEVLADTKEITHRDFPAFEIPHRKQAKEDFLRQVFGPFPVGEPPEKRKHTAVMSVEEFPDHRRPIRPERLRERRLRRRHRGDRAGIVVGPHKPEPGGLGHSGVLVPFRPNVRPEPVLHVTGRILGIRFDGRVIHRSPAKSRGRGGNQRHERLHAQVRPMSGLRGPTFAERRRLYDPSERVPESAAFFRVDRQTSRPHDHSRSHDRIARLRTAPDDPSSKSTGRDHRRATRPENLRPRDR
jgi:hypothetical protein